MHCCSISLSLHSLFSISIQNKELGDKQTNRKPPEQGKRERKKIRSSGNVFLVREEPSWLKFSCQGEVSRWIYFRNLMVTFSPREPLPRADPETTAITQPSVMAGKTRLIFSFLFFSSFFLLLFHLLVLFALFLWGGLLG